MLAFERTRLIGDASISAEERPDELVFKAFVLELGRAPVFDEVLERFGCHFVRLVLNFVDSLAPFGVMVISKLFSFTFKVANPSSWSVFAFS